MSKKINEKDLFGGDLPGELPMLTEREKNSIYKMSERKFNNDTVAPVEEGNTVTGVERYSRPVWKRRLASVAAAGVLLAGSGGLAYYIKNGSLDGFNNNSAVDMADPSSDQEYREIAKYLLDGYTDFRTRMEMPESDPDTIVKLTVEEEVIPIARYADKSINSMADFRTLGEKYMTEEFLDNNFDLSDAIDKSEFVPEESYTAFQFYKENANAMFFMYNGELYTFYNDYGTDVKNNMTYGCIEITDQAETSFRVKAVIRSFVMRANMDGPVTDINEAPYVFDIVRNEAGEWRISWAGPAKDKINVQPQQLSVDATETAKRLSDRYVQLEEYIFTRSTDSTEPSFTFYNVVPGCKTEVRLYEIFDDYQNTDNPFWNAHSIEEIKYNSGMTDFAFGLYFGCFYKLDDSVNAGDTISDEALRSLCDYKGLAFVEYKGAMYRLLENDENLHYIAPFTDEPNIVSETDTEIVFIREAGTRATHAEINSMPVKYEFKLNKDDDGVWRISEIEKLVSETDPSTVYFESMIYAYNHTVNALMSYDYIDSSRAITYYADISGKTKLCAEFAPYSHPDMRTPEDIESSLNELFTEDFLGNLASPYYSALSSKPIVDRDFGDYPDGYTWENPSSEELQNSPFVSMFIYRNGELYRNRNRAICWVPWYALNARFTVSEPEKRGDSYIVIADCVSNYPSDPASGIVTGTTRCEFRFEYEDDRWKIAEVGLLDNTVDTKAEDEAELKQLIGDYNKAAYALCSFDTVDHQNSIRYNTTSEHFFEFAGSADRNFSDPAQLEAELKRIFTPEFYQEKILINKAVDTIWTDKDFGSYSDGYCFGDNVDIKDTPYPYFFIYRNGEPYRNSALHFLPTAPADAQMTIVNSEIKDGLYAKAEATYTYNTDIGTEKVLLITFGFERNDTVWQICDINFDQVS